ncbi:hypothetical protein LX77_00291 [Gelidibacter algens]|jgi:hypothetical protein|uniref:Uncharacterized protein n=1 Tax=Gelidibacter algens TaxID=49280 RepID=A0A327SPW5_9FLAO|nr:hypothetical protein [Gelidibacter algens]RAJ27717.1 hypothetical protein LX77_00291 [Gelidibacter algens]
MSTIKKMMIPVLAFSLLMSCDFNKTDKGELPEVDVDVDAEAGELPEYDVDWAEVNVGTRTDTVEVPKVVVVMEEEEVEVPYLDIDMPNEGEKEERTLMVEAEVTGEESTIEIKEIWATGKKLIVISELRSTGKSIGDKNMRVSDQVTINAPELDVRYYVVGERPDRLFNRQHRYIGNASDIKDEIGDYKVIYSK